jgi:hypothetical protein
MIKSLTVPSLAVTALVAITSMLLVATLGPARQTRKIEPAPLPREE